jgi:predicted nucleic acid-binding protein
MTLVDTSYLVALLDVRDSLHARAKAWAACTTGVLIVTEYVLWETVNLGAGQKLLDHIYLGEML